ncbi:MAG: hypothetical protein WCA35_03660 [Kovacikia sp.]
MISSPVWSAPKPIDTPNVDKDNIRAEWLSYQPGIAHPLNPPLCQLTWQADTPLEPAQPLGSVSLAARPPGCRWSYQPLSNSDYLGTIGIAPEKSIKVLNLPDQKLKDSSLSESQTHRAQAASNQAVAIQQRASKARISGAKELLQPGNSPIQAAGFKADLVRPARSYKAATLSSASPFQPAPVLGTLPHQLPLKNPFSSSAWLLSQAAPPQTDRDPELGVLRLQEKLPPPPPPPTSGDASKQSQTAQSLPGCDPELGCIPLQPWRPPPPPRAPLIYLLARVDYFRSSNVFSAVDPVDDGLFRPGVTLSVVPPLGPKTYLIASVNGNFIRYSTQNQIDYNELLADVAIFQQLSPTMFAKFGWNYQQLYIYRDKIIGLPAGTRFLSDHAIKLELSRRDPLIGKLSLNTFYQLRIGFAEPANRSRILNSLVASLNYDIQPVLQVGLDYQITLAHFTQQAREDTYHQIGLRLSYTLFPNTQLNLFAGYGFGRSSDPTVSFDGLVFGASLGTSLPLF